MTHPETAAGIGKILGKQCGDSRDFGLAGTCARIDTFLKSIRLKKPA